MLTKAMPLTCALSLLTVASLCPADMIWNRQSDWTGQAGGNPAADGYGHPGVWLHEMWGIHDQSAHALSASPWYEDGPMMVGTWVDLTGFGLPYKGWGMSASGTIVTKDEILSGNAGTLGGALTSSVRWNNPLTESTELMISGSWGIAISAMAPAGQGQADVVILREPAGGGAYEVLYHHRSTAPLLPILSGPNVTHHIPSPIAFTAEPGDSIIVAGFPLFGGTDVLLSVSDDLSIGAKPMYDSLTGQTLDGVFTPDGAGGGQLVISDSCSLYCTGNVNKTYIDSSVELTLTMDADQSAGGIAKCTWDGGTLLIKDAFDTVLLTGDVIDLCLEETPANPDCLGGTGAIHLTGGLLMNSLPSDLADVVQVSFATPGPVDDFTTTFTCATNLTLLPVIPEPATVALLALGGFALLVRRRRHGNRPIVLLAVFGLLAALAAPYPAAADVVWNRQNDWPTPGALGTTENNPGPDGYGNPDVWQYEYWAGLDPVSNWLDDLTPWYTEPSAGLMQWAGSPTPGDPAILMGPGAVAGAAEEHFLIGTHLPVLQPQTSDAIAVKWTSPLPTAQHVYVSGSYGASYWAMNPTPGDTGRLDVAIVREPAGGGAPEVVYSKVHADVGSQTPGGAPLMNQTLPFIDVLMQPGDSLLFTAMPVRVAEQALQLVDDVTLNVGSLYDHFTVEMLHSVFTPSAPDAGQLTLDGTCTLYCDGDLPATYEKAVVACTLDLADDYSVAGRAMGHFDGGSITFTAADGTVLLTCDLTDLWLEELTATADTLLGSGDVAITGGDLAAYLIEDMGEVVTISFSAAGPIQDFLTTFECSTNLTISPVPEPATLSLLALAGLAILRRKKARSGN